MENEIFNLAKQELCLCVKTVISMICKICLLIYSEL